MGTRYRDTKIGKLKEEQTRKRGSKALKKAVEKAKEEGTYKHPMKDDKNRWNVKDIVKAVHSATGAQTKTGPKPPKRDARKRKETDYEMFKRMHMSGPTPAYKWKEPAKENK